MEDNSCFCITLVLKVELCLFFLYNKLVISSKFVVCFRSCVCCSIKKLLGYCCVDKYCTKLLYNWLFILAVLHVENTFAFTRKKNIYTKKYKDKLGIG